GAGEEGGAGGGGSGGREGVSRLWMPVAGWKGRSPADASQGGLADDPLQHDGDGWLRDESPIPPVQPGRIEKPSHDELAPRRDSFDQEAALADSDATGAFWAALAGSQNLDPVTVDPVPVSEVLDLFFGNLGLG